MASKVLSMCLKRLGEDWKRRWNASLLVVESFVDEEFYRGTCYRACNFKAVGATAGFEKSSCDFYVEHGRPKQLYLRELVPGAQKILRRENLPEHLAQEEVQIEERMPTIIGAKECKSLLEAFRTLKDSRSNRLHHPMYRTLACAAVATLLGAGSYQGFEDICKNLSQPQLRTLRCYCDKKTRIYTAPSDSTFHRVLKEVDPQEFEKIIATWLLQQKPAAIERLAVDGKALRGSAQGADKPLALLSAVTHNLRMTLSSVAIEEKSNEIPAIEPLLKNLNIEGTLITADAMHCQRKTAKLITQEYGADYCFGLKGNQEALLERAQIKLSSVPFTFEENPQKKHSRIKGRRIKRLAVTPQEMDFSGVYQIFALERILADPRCKMTTWNREISYYITSRSTSETTEEDLNSLPIGHSSAIENGTHHVRDRSFGEDACRIVNRNAARNMTALRNLANTLYALSNPLRWKRK